MKIKALREKIEANTVKMREILDKAEAEGRPDLTEDEDAAFKALELENTGIQAQIKREETLAGYTQPPQGGIRPHLHLPGNSDPAAFGSDAHFARCRNNRYQQLKAFKGDKADEQAYRAGIWALAALFGHEKSVQYCRDNGIPIRNAAGGDVNTKGGFLVPDEFEQTIIDLREEYGVARRECNVVPMARDTLVIPRRTGGLTAYFVDENPASAITESDKAWDKVSLTARKLATLSRMSAEIAEDAIINLADDLAREIAYAFAVKEDDCLFNGDGTSTYGGIQGVRPKLIDGNHAAGAVDVATATHNVFTEIDATDIMTLMAALPKYALRTAKFYCSQVAFSAVFERLVQAAGGNTIGDLAMGAQYRYMGYPIVISQSLPAGIATDYNNLVMFLFGDLRMAATLGNRRGTTVMMSEHRYFDTDQIGIRGTERFDINVHDLGDGTTAGPVVGMVGSSS